MRAYINFSCWDESKGETFSIKYTFIFILFIFKKNQINFISHSYNMYVMKNFNPFLMPFILIYIFSDGVYKEQKKSKLISL